MRTFAEHCEALAKALADDGHDPVALIVFMANNGILEATCLIDDELEALEKAFLDHRISEITPSSELD